MSGPLFEMRVTLLRKTSVQSSNEKELRAVISIGRRDRNTVRMTLLLLCDMNVTVFSIRVMSVRHIYVILKCVKHKKISLRRNFEANLCGCN